MCTFIRHNIAISQHKVKKQHAAKIINKVVLGWSWFDNYDHSSKGSLWVMWNGQKIDCQLEENSAQHIQVSVHIKALGLDFGFAAIYGLHTTEDKR